MIAVQGSIQTRSYEDKNGNKRTAVEIVADNAVSYTHLEICHIFSSFSSRSFVSPF